MCHGMILIININWEMLSGTLQMISEKKNNLPELKWSEEVYGLAQKHAQELADGAAFEIGSNETLNTRLAALPFGWVKGGENIYRTKATKKSPIVVEATANYWKDNTLQKQVLLEPQYTIGAVNVNNYVDPSNPEKSFVYVSQILVNANPNYDAVIEGLQNPKTKPNVDYFAKETAQAIFNEINEARQIANGNRNNENNIEQLQYVPELAELEINQNAKITSGKLPFSNAYADAKSRYELISFKWKRVIELVFKYYYVVDSNFAGSPTLTAKAAIAQIQNTNPNVPNHTKSTVGKYLVGDQAYKYDQIGVQVGLNEEQGIVYYSFLLTKKF